MNEIIWQRRRPEKPAWPRWLLCAAGFAVAFWAGRATHRHHSDDCPECLKEYERGFDAGVLEGTTKWEEWK